MEDPDWIPETNIFVLDFLSCLIELKLDFVLALLWEYPGIEDRVVDKIEIHLMHLEALLDLHVQERSRVKGHICVDILLVVKAGLQTENAAPCRDLRQLQRVLVILHVLRVAEIFWGMNMLQHKILIVFDGGVDLLLLQLVVLLQLEFKLVDENFGLLFILDYSLVLVTVPIIEDFF